MKLQLGVMAHQNTPTTQSLVVTSQYWTQLLGFAYMQEPRKTPAKAIQRLFMPMLLLFKSTYDMETPIALNSAR